MDYEKTLEYIHSLNKFGIKPGLERITALTNALGNPEKELSFIHVAGTNGKGSTSTMLSNIMRESGKKTGLFISPFVVDFTERIQLNGSFIEKKDLCRLTEKVRPVAEKVSEELLDPITEFEFITAVALLYFKEMGADIVVLETGLGGRLDSTNIIKSPLASVITKIDLDHTLVLGDTIEKIAKEKCGIIKENSLVVTPSTQNKEALRVIENTAIEKKCSFVLADREDVKDIELCAFGTNLIYKDIKLSTSLAGIHQVENVTLATETALSLGVDKTAIVKGVEKTFFPARLEVISKNPLVILDGAHNKNGADALCSFIDLLKIKPIVLLGMMKDKDCEAVLSKIANRASKVLTVTVPSNARAESAENLANIAKKYCSFVKSFEDIDCAFDYAKTEVKKSSIALLCCGSLYLASDIRPKLLSEYSK